jgi:hypothetical protein
MKSNNEVLKRLLDVPFASHRYEQIEAILAAGKVARFTIPHAKLWKDVNEWNMDADGDLTAFRISSNAASPLTCWYNRGYLLTQVEP